MINKNIFYKGKEKELPMFFQYFEINPKINSDKTPSKLYPNKPISQILLNEEQKKV